MKDVHDRKSLIKKHAKDSKMLESTEIILRQAKRLYKKLELLEKNYTKWIPDGHDQFWNEVFDNEQQ